MLTYLKVFTRLENQHIAPKLTITVPLELIVVLPTFWLNEIPFLLMFKKVLSPILIRLRKLNPMVSPFYKSTCFSPISREVYKFKQLYINMFYIKLQINSLYY